MHGAENGRRHTDAERDADGRLAANAGLRRSDRAAKRTSRPNASRRSVARRRPWARWSIRRNCLRKLTRRRTPPGLCAGSACTESALDELLDARLEVELHLVIPSASTFVPQKRCSDAR